MQRQNRDLPQSVVLFHTAAAKSPSGREVQSMSRKSYTRMGALTFLVPLVGVAADPEPADTEIWEPEPMVVAPGRGDAPPADAIVLFGGPDLSMWQHENGGDAQWVVGDGWFEVKPGSGDIRTRESFGDCQLHVEWSAPARVEGEGQSRGNSGIFLQQRYEVQVLDSWKNRTYSNGQAASIYKQAMPLVNASRPPGEWQTYDIIYRAPKFSEDGALESPATMTVLHNGVLVQDHVAVRGTTVYTGEPSYTPHAARAPLRLQDHDNPVRFRNIWIRPLD